MVLISNFDLSGTSRRCLRRSFRPPFSKGGADPTRGALVASAEAKLLFAAFLFCQAREALAPPGGVKRSQFSFGPSVSKKKAGNRFKKCLRAKENSLRLGEVHPLAQRLRGPPHLCGSPLPSRGSAFTLLWRLGRIGEFRSLRRATNAPRVGSAPPFEKGGRKLLRRHRREVPDKSKFEVYAEQLHKKQFWRIME